MGLRGATFPASGIILFVRLPPSSWQPLPLCNFLSELLLSFLRF